MYSAPCQEHDHFTDLEKTNEREHETYPESQSGTEGQDMDQAWWILMSPILAPFPPGPFTSLTTFSHGPWPRMDLLDMDPAAWTDVSPRRAGRWQRRAARAGPSMTSEAV